MRNRLRDRVRKRFWFRRSNARDQHVDDVGTGQHQIRTGRHVFVSQGQPGEMQAARGVIEWAGPQVTVG
jgi:hypothetical protein